MKINCLDYGWKSLHIRLSILLLALLSIILSGCLLEFGPADKTLTNLSLAEAQDFTKFTICTPTYLPEGIESTSHVTYHAEMGDPADVDIRTRYNYSGTLIPAIEVYQKDWPENLERLYRDNSRIVSEKWELIDWAIGSVEAQKIAGGVTVSHSSYKDTTTRWLFQITQPEAKQANMIVWTDGDMFYQVYTRLAVDDAKKIARSIKDCIPASPKK